MAKIDQPLILSIRENYERQELIRWDFDQIILLKQRSNEIHRGENHLFGNPCEKSEISYALASNPFEKRDISYVK